MLISLVSFIVVIFYNFQLIDVGLINKYEVDINDIVSQEKNLLFQKSIEFKIHLFKKIMIASVILSFLLIAYKLTRYILSIKNNSNTQ